MDNQDKMKLSVALANLSSAIDTIQKIAAKSDNESLKEFSNLLEAPSSYLAASGHAIMGWEGNTKWG